MAPELHHAVVALKRLLVNLFDTEGLLRWMKENYPDALIQELPGKMVSPIEMSHEVVDILERHGLIDDLLFIRLSDARPHRHAEIEAVHTMHTQSQPMTSHHAGTIRVASMHAWTHRYRVALRCTIALSVLFILTRWYSTLDISRVLRSGENAIFSFLPLAYQRLALPLLVITAATITAAIRLFSQQSTLGTHPTKDKR